MTRHCHQLAMILVLGAGFALAQSGAYPAPQPNPAHRPDPMPGQTAPAQPQSNQDQAGSAEVQTKIESAIHQDPSLSGASVSVSVSDTMVELSGTVSSDAAKESAASIAKANAGARKVRNRIKVEGKESQNSSPGAPPKR